MLFSERSRLLYALFYCLLVVVSCNPSPGPKQLSAKEARKLAEDALSKNNHKGAIDFYSQLIDVEPTAANYFKRASSYLRLKQYESAVTDLETSLSVDNKNSRARAQFARTLVLIGRCQAAAEEYQKLLTETPGDAKSVDGLKQASQCVQRIQLAQHNAAHNNWAQAKAQYSGALEIAHESMSLLLERARCHLYLGELHEVVADTMTVLKANKKNLVALYLRGTAYYHLREFEAAKNHYQEGMRLDPEDQDIKTMLKKLKALQKFEQAADEQSRAGKHAEAAASLEQAVSVDPNHRAHNLLLLIKQCKAYNAAKQGAQGEAACTRALQIDQDNIDAYLERVESKFLLEKWQEAINDAQAAIQRNQNHQGAHQKLQRAQQLLKQSEQKDYYKILGLTRQASKADVKKAFRKLALQYHPDKQQTEDERKVAEEKFKEIGEAYEVLFDEEVRAKYDRGEEIKPNQGGGQQQHPFYHFFQQQGHPGQQFHFQWG